MQKSDKSLQLSMNGILIGELIRHSDEMIGGVNQVIDVVTKKIPSSFLAQFVDTIFTGMKEAAKRISS